MCTESYNTKATPVSGEACSMVPSSGIVDCALVRAIFSEARRRHQLRPTVKCRELEREALLSEGGDGETTLWTLARSTQILQEALHDVRAAVKACLGVNATLQSLHEAVEGRKAAQDAAKAAEDAANAELHGKLAKHRLQIASLAFLRRQLDDAHNESEWADLAKLIREE
jgi:hypothetical protein